jgi:hypothetical protein
MSITVPGSAAATAAAERPPDAPAADAQPAVLEPEDLAAARDGVSGHSATVAAYKSSVARAKAVIARAKAASSARRSTAASVKRAAKPKTPAPGPARLKAAARRHKSGENGPANVETTRPVTSPPRPRVPVHQRLGAVFVNCPPELVHRPKRRRKDYCRLCKIDHCEHCFYRSDEDSDSE